MLNLMHVVGKRVAVLPRASCPEWPMQVGVHRGPHLSGSGFVLHQIRARFRLLPNPAKTVAGKTMRQLGLQ